MNPFVPLVPRLWAPEEALAAVTLLRTCIDAIWQVHGEAMVLAVGEDPDRWPLEDLVDLDTGDDSSLGEEPPY